MSILDSIKGERKLSLNNWRYRILHWTFGIKDPTPSNIYYNGMPKFLYTHFCPLFHLTNFILLLSPIILFVKIVAWLCKATASTLQSVPWHKISAFFKKFISEKKCTDECSIPKVTAEQERRRCIKLLCEWNNDFENFWCYYNFVVLNKEQVKDIFDEYMPKVMKAREEAKLRKEKWRQRIIFWINFSRSFIKGGLNILYFGFTALLLWGVYEAAFPVWDFICWIPGCVIWLFSDIGTSYVFWVVLKVVFWSTIITGSAALLIQGGIATKFLDLLMRGCEYISPPFIVLLVPFKWIVKCLNNTVEFVSMFYEENCPPVTIISDEEAIVESVARNGEEV